MQNATNHIKRELQLTADGSHTLFIPEMDEHYHSVNGAVQESRHVFIEAGLHHLERKEIVVLEIGFGTGLNAFLTLLDAEVHQRKIHYYSVELYPLDMDVIESLNYGEMICAGRKDVFQALHQAEWNVAVQVTDFFGLHKIQGDSNTCVLPDRIDLVYFDAFAPDKQPEMWNQEIFNRLYARMTGGGVLTTYCAKGVVRRMMKEAGYSVERIPGPPGKREMLRAITLYKSFYFRFECSFMFIIYLFIYNLAVFEEKNGRNITDAKLCNHVVVVVYIHFADSNTAFIFGSQFIDDRTNHAARTTPFSPEVKDHRLTRVYQLFKICICNL